ncbi:AmmeMemoRadiSam system radical SAM enzyme [Victivallis sp. Marseille-Q1083]|uniref:AmmeMemoRadiSam system radical SAM enzyme n=1 Tax=Victivallis sp. Marseille-Q1083 TaxID=2717288 RepID=UPI00158BE049|nr:AmmeMemoRadiSam system radical SAM enzyme [Victivallis sp. Marseille-Q1083]
MSSDTVSLHEAGFYRRQTAERLECLLCPRHCVIHDNSSGFCRVRVNHGGVLYALTYGYPVALHNDPIEKKPLARFQPGSRSFSIGTFGCNMDCAFCQNDTLSHGTYNERFQPNYIEPQAIVEQAFKERCASIAFTYNEPTVFIEYAMDIARLARRHNLKTVLVSNGYITPAAAQEFYPLIDAANIDVKAFSERFYEEMTNSRLAVVLDAVESLFRLGIHLELTTLVIPGYNDAPEEIDAYLNWVERHLSCEVPLHFNAFHPAYKCLNIPRTPRETLELIRDRAVERGFRAVYLGNI